MRFLLFLVLLLPKVALAHEMTPTFFELKPSLYNNVYVTEMSFFNKREDAKFYEISVYDKDFNPVSFATADKIFQSKMHSRSTISIYIRKKDLDNVVYICTESKLLKGEVDSTGITSRICSKKK